MDGRKYDTTSDWLGPEYGFENVMEGNHGEGSGDATIQFQPIITSINCIT